MIIRCDKEPTLHLRTARQAVLHTGQYCGCFAVNVLFNCERLILLVLKYIYLISLCNFFQAHVNVLSHVNLPTRMLHIQIGMDLSKKNKNLSPLRYFFDGITWSVYIIVMFIDLYYYILLSFVEFTLLVNENLPNKSIIVLISLVQNELLYYVDN